MNDKILKQSIDRLDIDVRIIEFLKENGILTIKDLTNKTKTDLKKLTLSLQEIHKIQVELQLLGYNLEVEKLKKYMNVTGK